MSDQDLYYLLHDKSHVIKPGERCEALDAKLREVDQATIIAVYRGLDHYNVAQLVGLSVGDVLSIPNYWSATQHRMCADEWARSYKTERVIEIEAGAPGFALWHWGAQGLLNMRLNRPEEYESSDGDFLLDSYLAESEWIFGIDQNFVVTAVGDDGFPTKLRAV